MEFFTRLFNTSDFPPRWTCGRWSEAHGWLHIISDLGVWSAYVAIPIVLGYFFLKKRDLPFRKIFLLFGAFILACGTTHLMEAIIFWWPVYRVAGLIKFFTAIISWATVIALIPIVPRVLAMRSPEDLDLQIQSLTKELREASQRKDEFLATLAHELRNPLAPLRHSLELMKQSGDDPEVNVQARETMGRQLSQMVRLVDDLLDISRITRNKMELRRSTIELSTAIHHAVEMCAPLIQCAEHQIELELPDEAIYVHADPVRLAQVFSNLLNNACKFTNRSGKIQIQVERRDQYASIIVRDNGTGIPPDKLQDIFEMFTQVDASLERVHGGLGIGLTLVKRLVEMHGGTVAAASEGLGLGSEFHVILPTVLNETTTDTSSSPVAARPQTSRRILIVDDNQDSAVTLSMLLNQLGHDCRVAFDGHHALVIGEDFKPQVLLLDIGMPRMNGFELCKRCRASAWGATATIVALTGWGQDEDRRKTSEAGFDGHLVKPVAYDRLMEVIASR